MQFCKYFLSVAMIGFFAVTATTPVTCQTNDEKWSKVSTLSPGTRLVVQVDVGRTVKGKFLNATGQDLRIRVGGRDSVISRNEVSAIFLGKRSSRITRGFIGALAGAGAGVAIGVIAVTAAKSDPLVAAGGFLIGIPVGAAIGAATGGGTKTGDLIYSR